jgi:hypothetical protein
MAKSVTAYRIDSGVSGHHESVRRAEYGRTTGGVVNAIMKQGTNRLRVQRIRVLHERSDDG